jgi:hypothetical protein
VKAALLTGAGRPLRVLLLLVFAGLAWLATRVPAVITEYDAVIAANATPELRSRPLEMARVAAPTPVAGVPALALRLPSRRNAAPAMPRQAIVSKAVVPAAPIPSAVAPAPVPVAPVAAAAIAANAAPPTAVVAVIPGFELAAAGYDRLAAGDRRGADALFGAALAAAAGHDVPQAADWRRAQRQLRRRWSGDAYVLLRDSGLAGPAASPVLGGGQSGASLAYTLDPLARRSLAVFGRIYAAHDSAISIDPATAQAAIGLRWQARPGISIAAERLIALGAATSGDWNLRVAAGGARRVGQLDVDGYGEAGARGNGDLYAGGEAHARLPIGRVGLVQWSAGPGLWGSVQSAGAVVGRVDVGAGVTARLPAGLAISGDWRWRVAGNAAPGSGPAVTIGMAF